MTHARTALLVIGIFSALGVSACDKKHGRHGSDRADRVERQPLTGALFGKSIARFGPIAKLKWGMTPAEAKVAAPELFGKKPDEISLTDDPTYDHVEYAGEFDRDSKKLSSLSVLLPTSAQPMIPAAWGAGKDAKTNIGEARTYWFDAAAGERAYLEKSYGDGVDLKFEPYVPVAKLLGDGADTIGFAPQGILGATLADLRTRFPTQLVETDAATAAKERQDLNAMVGSDTAKKVDALGAPTASVRIDLLPTEWGLFWSRVDLRWNDKTGTIETFRFDLPYGMYPPAKAEILAALTKKWGTPKPGKDLNRDILIFHAGAPFIYAEDDTITNAWQMEVDTEVPHYVTQ